MPQNRIIVSPYIKSDRKMQVKINQFRLLKMMEEIQGYAILLLDKFGNVETWNKGAEQIKGYTADEIIGKHFSIFYTKEELKNGLPGKLLVEASEKGSIYDESWRVRKDKTTFWGSVTINALYDEDGMVVGFAKITRDLTEKMLAENTIQQHLHDLELKNKELEQFAYIASHDLQEPLLTITNFIELLQSECKENLNEDSILYFDFIAQAANRMKYLIKGLLDYSRIGIESATSVIDCRLILDELQQDLAASIGTSGAIIRCADLPKIKGRPIEIKQVFQNLIGNAIKFRDTSTKPIIDISAKKENKFWLFSVKDNGIGIDKKFKNKVFRIFKRLHTRDIYDGNGIGLAHCKKIIETHGGEIYVESKLGKGSTFYFTIPVYNL